MKSSNVVPAQKCTAGFLRANGFGTAYKIGLTLVQANYDSFNL